MAHSIVALSDRVSSLGDLIDDVLRTVGETEGPASDGDPRVAIDDRLREILVGLERLRNAAEAVQADVMVAMASEAQALDDAEFAASGTPARSHGEFVPDEVGMLLACTKVAAGRGFGLALHAAEHPALMCAWSAGAIDGRKIQVVADEVGVLSDREVAGELSGEEIAELSEQLTAAGAEHARTHTWSETRAWLRRRVMRVAPEAAELRRGRAEQERRVQITPADDGMSELWAWLRRLRLARSSRRSPQRLMTWGHAMAARWTSGAPICWSAGCWVRTMRPPCTCTLWQRQTYPPIPNSIPRSGCPALAR